MTNHYFIMTNHYFILIIIENSFGNVLSANTVYLYRNIYLH